MRCSAHFCIDPNATTYFQQICNEKVPSMVLRGRKYCTSQCSTRGLLARRTSQSVQLVKWGDYLEVLHALKTGWKKQKSQHCCLFSTPPTWNDDSSVGSNLLHFFFSPCRHLFSYITKDKQTESLVEKLCQRFRTARWVVILIFLPSASASQDFSEEMSLYVVLVKASHYILHVAKWQMQRNLV